MPPAVKSPQPVRNASAAARPGARAPSSATRNPNSALLKVKPKYGLPRQLKAHLGVVLRVSVMVGATYGLQQWLHDNPDFLDVEPPAEHGHAEHGHGDTKFTDLQCSIGIVTMLIAVTIVFEKAKHSLEHNVPPMMSAVLSALFGELTVLGFIALYAFFLLQTGAIPAVSVMVYGDPEHMLHLFEEIHFMLFFVMVVFLFQAFSLVRALQSVEDVWMESEKVIREKSKGPAPAIAMLLATAKAARFNCCRLCCLRPLWAYRVAEARAELRYALLRERFIAPPTPKVGDTPLPPDFDFSSYLRFRGAELVTHVLHVSTGTWMTVLFFLVAVLESPVRATATLLSPPAPRPRLVPTPCAVPRLTSPQLLGQKVHSPPPRRRPAPPRLRAACRLCVTPARPRVTTGRWWRCCME